MDRLVLHKLPRKQREGKRSSVPIDRRVDVDGFQCGEQVSLLVIRRGEQRLPGQRTDIVLVLSRPIHFSRRQRGSVDTAHRRRAAVVCKTALSRRQSDAVPVRAQTFRAGA